MRINICTIDKNGEDGRQTIYWESNTGMIHTTEDQYEQIGTVYETLEEAADTAYELWQNGWGFEWVEYVIKPEFLDKWGPDAYTDTTLNASQIGAFCRGWEMDATEVMDQLEEK